MRPLKLIRTIMAVTLLIFGILFYSPARANTITFTPATKNVGAKTWPVLSYYGDDDYDSGDYDSSDEYDGSSDYDDGGDD